MPRAQKPRKHHEKQQVLRQLRPGDVAEAESRDDQSDRIRHAHAGRNNRNRRRNGEKHQQADFEMDQRLLPLGE
jgi:hypothetical protein